jgi:hypothetical protein
MDTPEILTKAIDVIEERGWYQGASVDPDGTGVCAVVAMCVAAGLPPDTLVMNGDRVGAMSVLAAAGELELFLDLGLPATQWNDEFVDTRDEVITALRECAAELKASA